MKNFASGICRKSIRDTWQWYITHDIEGEQIYYLFPATPDGFTEFAQMQCDTRNYDKHIYDIVCAYIEAVTKNETEVVDGR